VPFSAEEPEHPPGVVVVAWLTKDLTANHDRCIGSENEPPARFLRHGWAFVSANRLT